LKRLFHRNGKKNLTAPSNELVILRQVIPWQGIITRLVPFYKRRKGRRGKALRMMVAVVILSRLRHLSDEGVIQAIRENRSMQYFCNVPDKGLATFLHPSTLCRFRKRLGTKGMAVLEDVVFEQLRQAGVIQGDALLMDSSVLESNIIYPNDVRLLYKAFDKMYQFAHRQHLPTWWDQDHLKKRWRAFNLSKQAERNAYLIEFYALFMPALDVFRTYVRALAMPKKTRTHAANLLSVLSMLETQTQQKLAGEQPIANRLVSLDELDARPIKKGKAHPSCEFGTTIQMTFNRQGFLITTENFIGQPNDKTLYSGTLQLFTARMERAPDHVVTDLGFRSRQNFKNTPETIGSVFLGRSDDVEAEQRDFCRSARSATEGFIAVAKHLRGFGRSLYRGLQGDRIWTLVCQTAYNLKKLVQLYRQERLTEESLVKLGLLVE
jgi:transposase, IS5 family